VHDPGVIDRLLASVHGLREWLAQSDVSTKILAGLVTSALVSLVAWAFHSAKDFVKRRRLRNSFSRQITRYRDKLERDAFRVHHSWMREGQTLEEILIPVIVTDNTGIESLQDLFLKASSESNRSGRPIRLVVTGAPGSGKSVALRLIARLSLLSLGDAGSKTRLGWLSFGDVALESPVPVAMTFADYRRSGFDMAATVTQSLTARHFKDPGNKWEHSAEEFARERLSDGHLLLLLDGLDELRLEDRREAAQRLVAFAGAHPTVSIVVGCRTVAFRELRDSLAAIEPSVVEMAELIPSSIREFVRRWRFDPPKSDGELFGILSSRPHLRELAKNPLTLTITTFLYSLPKYRLPDNRAQFYEVCARALLEEWDQSQSAERANRFDRPHKEQILARLAYEHLCGRDPDQDIDEHFALGTFASEMQKIGLNPGQNAQLLKEIEENAGLLMPLPPNGLRFPHQTFLEYFASLYLVRNLTTTILIDLYRSDTRRWRETLLLYCGLNTQTESTAIILDTALEARDLDLAIEALTSARAIPSDAATQVLDRVDALLKDAPTPHLVQHVGALAANRQSAFAERALRMLTSCVATSEHLSDEVLQALILTLIRHQDAGAVNLILDNFERLQIHRVLAAMDEDSVQQIVSRLSLERLTRQQQTQVVEALRLSKMPRALYEILHASSEANLTHLAAIALGRLSNERPFWELLNDPRLPPLPASDSAEQLLRRWGWPNIPVRTPMGRHAFFIIARHLADAMFDGSYFSFEAPKAELHAWISYLAHGLAYESRYPGIKWHELGRAEKARTHLILTHMLPVAIRTIWRSVNTPLGWFRHARNEVLGFGIILAIVTFLPAVWFASGRALDAFNQTWESRVALIWLTDVVALFGLGLIDEMRRGDKEFSIYLVVWVLLGPSVLGPHSLWTARKRAKPLTLYLALNTIWIGICLWGGHTTKSEPLKFLMISQAVCTAVFMNWYVPFSPWWSFRDDLRQVGSWLGSAQVPIEIGTRPDHIAS
jgi:hypothetical protein